MKNLVVQWPTFVYYVYQMKTSLKKPNGWPEVVNVRRSDSAILIARRYKDKKTMDHKTLHMKVKIEQHKLHFNLGRTAGNSCSTSATRCVTNIGIPNINYENQEWACGFPW